MSSGMLCLETGGGGSLVFLFFVSINFPFRYKVESAKKVIGQAPKTQKQDGENRGRKKRGVDLCVRGGNI